MVKTRISASLGSPELREQDAGRRGPGHVPTVPTSTGRGRAIHALPNFERAEGGDGPPGEHPQMSLEELDSACLWTR